VIGTRPRERGLESGNEQSPWRKHQCDRILRPLRPRRERGRLTGFLGGAIATHVRVEDPLLTHTLFPIYVSLLIWGGLLLRDDRLRAFTRQALSAPLAADVKRNT
jgi:hypothetical protein